MTNTEWIDLLVKEWNVNRSVAKEMLHQMHQVKRRDTLRKELQNEDDPRINLVVNVSAKSVDHVRKNFKPTGYSFVPMHIQTGFISAILNGTPLPKRHGRLGDLDELEQRISNFVEHDSNITDKYTVIRQRFIVEGIHETPTIIEADKNGDDE